MIEALLGGVAVAGAGTWAGFQTMWPTSQVYGRTFIGVEPGARVMALTYDDGPNDPYTMQLLEVLERHGVKAAFFMIGRFVEQRPDLARAVVAAGHTVGVHTWDHPKLLYVSQSRVRQQLESTRKVIEDVTGVTPSLFRPPFGGRRPATLRVARQLGLTTVMWNVTCYDWKARSADEIMRHAERQIRGGDVILLHDGEYHRIGVDRSRSVEASDRLLTRYLAEGYQFLTIPEMMQRNPTT